MKRTIYFLSFLIIVSCAPSRFVQPLEQGTHSVGFNAGGPLIEYSGKTIPVPLTGLFYGYGYKENLTLFGSLHTTSLAFGNFQTDIGATYKFLEQDKFIPSLSVSPVANIVFHFNDPNFKIWPQVDLNAYWEHGKNKNYLYLGISNWFELSGKKAHDEATLDRWLINPHIGYTYNTNSFSYSLEMKFLGLSHNNEYVFVPYQSFTGNSGATGIFLGITKRF
ncbi:MAG: hypothetical protein U9R42_09945 [Bacteroidota bacterium]|nr:hypothetical protein [Bacteroidota bacterium]